MPGRILGIDIHDNSIAAVQVVSTLKGYQVTACACVAIEGDDGLESALGEIFDQADLKSDIYHGSISGEKISYRNLQLPFVDLKKIRQTLPFEIETMVPFSIDDLVVDFVVIDRSEQSDILAASVEKTVISAYLDQLQPYGVDPDVLDIRGVPVVLRLLKQEATPENGIFLQMDGGNNTMVLFLKRRIVLIRTFTFNGVTAGAAASAGANGSGPDKQLHEQDDSYYRALITQVQNSLHGYGVQNNREVRPEKIFFTGTKAVLPETEDILSRLFGIPVEPVDLCRDEKICLYSDIAEAWNPALMSNALALALRDTKKDHGFNFRKNEFEKKKHYFGSRKEIRRAATFLILLLCFLAADLGSDYFFLKKRYETLHQNITAVFKDTFPDMTIIPRGKELDLMTSEINKIKKSSDLHPSIAAASSVLHLLKDISQRIPESMSVRITNMVIDLEAVRISGITDTFNTVDKIKNDLESSAYYRGATISSAKLDRTGEKVEFEIKLDRVR